MSAPQQVVSVSTGYEPRPLQAAIHREMTRFSVLAIHRRFGKTVLAVNKLIDSMLRCSLHNPRVGYVAPFLKQAKAVAWDYAKDYTANIPGVKHYESELRIDIPVGKVNGKRSVARLMLFGADHPDSLRFHRRDPRGIPLRSWPAEPSGRRGPGVLWSRPCRRRWMMRWERLTHQIEVALGSAIELVHSGDRWDARHTQRAASSK